ncbi:MAG TPA: hypothetical protein VHS78_17170 [Candidatus Elarobacter sp.]|jgi:hypothetical protein|nr:hypothetical protein [Candidatus Elarobacter sp.]
MVFGGGVFLLGIGLALSAGSLAVPVEYAVLFALLCAPGYAAARRLVRRFAFDPAVTLTLAFAVTALGGYLAFWCYFFSATAGKAVAVLWILAALASLAVLARRKMPRDEAVPLALTFAAGLFYLAVLYLPAVGIDAAHRFFVVRPPDNVLPVMIAEHLYRGEDLHHVLGDWLSSDRPPLQTGIILLVRPVFRLFGNDPNAAFEIAGLFAQLVWIPATWLLCAHARFAPLRRALILAFMVFSGFFLYNTVYTWPKLLAAGLCVAAFVFALPSRRENRDAALTVSGICAALALLAHGSAVFFIVPALVVLLVMRRLPLSRGLVMAAVAGTVLLVPWSAYQKYYDPPGDRLLKMHLAGINDVDPRPALTAIRQAYQQTPPAQILENKKANVLTALGDAPLLVAAMIGEPDDALSMWRLREREQITFALGAANLGWLALPWWWSTRRDPAERRWVAGLLGIAVISALFWCAVMWGPGATVTTHSAYVLDLLLFVVTGAALAALPIRLALAVLALAVIDLVVTWIAGSLGDAWRTAPSLDPVMIAVALAAALATGVLLIAAARAPDASAPAPRA